MSSMISVIIPNRNGERTIGRCLEAVFAANYPAFEVVVVDDCSADNSAAIIARFPCKLVRLDRHMGAAAARNIGASRSKGRILFFTDADCIIPADTLARVERAFKEEGAGTVIGGTYTLRPFDSGFFALFQSIFIHYSETKKARNPDYIATHAMAIDAALFERSGGFKEEFFPILEDVEFSHRLRRTGARLLIRPEIMVRHVFNYSLAGSLRNAFIKSMYWTMYSLANRDLLSDSGTASVELKVDVFTFFVLALLGIALLVMPDRVSPLLFAVPLAGNIFFSRRLLRLFHATGGMIFALSAGCYYMLIYPLAVGLGGLAGLWRHLRGRRC